MKGWCDLAKSRAVHQAMFGKPGEVTLKGEYVMVMFISINLFNSCRVY